MKAMKVIKVRNVKVHGTWHIQIVLNDCPPIQLVPKFSTICGRSVSGSSGRHFLYWFGKPTLKLNIPQICVDKDIFVGRTFPLKILFSLERSLSFVRTTKSCGRHHLTCPILFPQREEAEIGDVFTA